LQEPAASGLEKRKGVHGVGHEETSEEGEVIFL
jgi:hypothetical protein